ncbi:unnamed protein product [Mytilus edulis]|uniref:Uncharacterized protein n=1 Tax=Mytilus edulis TaxID=6550 RepID=A0A8S3PR71_MYTED|nr:unnamed protein product [Mytilus edulis]
MVSTILVFMGLHFFSISGFLLDSTKSPQAENGISESHFTTLLKLLVDERKSREQLENVVLRLQQELSNKVSSSDHCNCKSAEITEELNNNTEQLKTELGYLRKEFDTLQLQCGQFDKHVSSNRAYTERPTQGTGDLKELKGTADLETILGLENKTNHLEVKVYNMELSLQSIVSGANARSKKLIGIVNKIKATDNLTLYLTNEIQKSNGKLSAVMTDMNSRKQDFIALVNKTEFTNDKLRSLEIWLENKIHYLETNFTVSVSNITNTVNQSLTSLQKYLMNSVQHLQSGLNDTYQKLDKISNRGRLLKGTLNNSF